MKKIILIPRSVSPELSKIFKVSKVSIWKALVGKTNSSRAQLIRKAAIDRGGVETNLKVVTPINKNIIKKITDVNKIRTEL